VTTHAPNPEPPFKPLISVLVVAPPAVYGGELLALSEPTMLARVVTAKLVKTATAENDVDMTLRETLTKPSIWALPKKEMRQQLEVRFWKSSDRSKILARPCPIPAAKPDGT
jgi:hypothetical protein